LASQPASSALAPAGRRAPRRKRSLAPLAGGVLGRGLLVLYLSVLVLLPIAALSAKAFSGGTDSFWKAVSSPEAWAAIKLTLIASVIVVLVNAVFGTIIAWVLVRDEFPGKGIVNATIDLPFALPTIVAGLVLLSLYGKNSPVGINVTFTRAAVVLAGIALSFARAVGEYGSLVLITGNLPFKTEAGSVFIFGQIENENLVAAAAVSVVLLLIALAVLAVLNLAQRRWSRHVL
jgi:sulfate transport system permease protein